VNGQASKNPLGIEEVRDRGVTSAAAEAFLFKAGEVFAGCSFFNAYRIWHGLNAQAAGIILVKSLMHFGSYLMIAALVLTGLQVLYTLYQLATFML